MHPDIKAFWEEIGEVDLTPSAPIIYYVVVHKYLRRRYTLIAEVWNGGPRDGPEQPNKYFYDGASYSESEMLRLIRQKAFM